MPLRVISHTLAFPRSLRMLNHSLVMRSLRINNMMSIIYKSLFFTIATIAAYLFSISFVFAQESDAFLRCEDVVFTLVGSDSIVAEHNYTYALSVALLNASSAVSDSLERVIVPQDILASTRVQYELFQNSRVLQRSSDSEFLYQFPQL